MVLLPGDLLDRPQGCREEALALAKALRPWQSRCSSLQAITTILCPGSPYLERAWPGECTHLYPAGTGVRNSSGAKLPGLGEQASRAWTAPVFWRASNRTGAACS